MHRSAGRISGGDRLELLFEGRNRVVGEAALALAHHVNHFDASQGDGGRGERLETQHRPHPPLDAPVILLDPVIQVLALADTDRPQSSRRPIQQVVSQILKSARDGPIA